VIRYAPSSSTDSPQSWELIGRWLNQCIHKHDRCSRASLEPWIPTRLLDIGNSEDSLVRLLDCDETRLLSKLSYATLSHCWGNPATTGSNLIKTTTRNLRSHQHEIPRERLPPTFKDAIKVARNFQIRYLWIDSLCIIQDDPKDWAHEANLMSKVYRYSFINIAATGSSSSDGGCFWKRDERTVLPTEVYIQWRNSWSDCNQEATRTKYRVVLEADAWTRKLTDEPLNRRGWVLQERILSPRLIHFGREQLFWECRESFTCETYPLGLPTALQSHPLINIKRLQLADESEDNRWPARYVSETPQDISYARRLWEKVTAVFRPIVIQETTLHAALINAPAYEDWYAVLELYSMGELTKDDDKLVALSGIAQTIITVRPSQLGDGYLAGLWQSSLPASLLWQRTYTETTSGTRRNGGPIVPYKALSTCEDRIIAPTWSWASIRGHISFTSCRVNYKSGDYLALLEDAAVSYFGAYRFGRVKSGFLKISGPVAVALWESKHRDTGFDSSSHKQSRIMVITHTFPSHLTRQTAVCIDMEEWPSRAEILLDATMDDWDVPEELTLLCIVATKESNGHVDIVRGLVLHQSFDGEGYNRIGVFVTRRERLRRILVNMPRQSVTIK
jgi:hypothetical protein